MKKVLLLILIAVAASTASATNYFTLRTATDTVVNGTLRVDPSRADSYVRLYTVAHFDGYLDHWYLTIIHPDNMDIQVTVPDTLSIKEGPAMNVPYINSAGIDTVLHALLLNKFPNQPGGTNLFNSYFSSTITDYGYWDQYNNNTYLPYGTVKWEPGDQDYFFEFRLYIPDQLLDADVTLNAALSSTTDWRGVPTVNQNPCISNIHIHVGFKRGDVNGDGLVNINDVTQLNDWLMHYFEGASIYQLDASDVNGDGELSIADVTTLTDILLGV